MTGKTIASVSGIDSATTAPGRTPRLTKLAAMMIRIACHKRGRELVDREVDRDRLVGDQDRLDADRQLGAGSRPSRCSMLRPSARMSPPSRIAIAEADRGLAVDAEHRLRRVGVAAADLGDVAQADHAVADDEVDRRRMSCSESKAPETRSESRSSPVCRTPAGRTTFCAWSAAIRAG